MKNIFFMTLLLPMFANATISDIGGNIISSMDSLGGAMTMKNKQAPDAFSNNVSNTKQPAITLKKPDYLSVADFDKCLDQEKQESYVFWCLPAYQKEACPNNSWKQLQDMDLKNCNR